MPGSKKDRKNAKDGGGIAAAVTKQAAGKFASNTDDNSVLAAVQSSKLGNGSGNSSRSRLESDASSPPATTPEVRPFPVPSHASQASPLLDALSSASVSASTAPSMANEWARGGFAGSPGNLISLMGESPPTQPSSYEESARMHQHWGSPRPFMSASPASPSPPSRRPLSVQMDAHYHAYETPPPGVSAAYRRSSMHSQLSHARNGSNPPLPHQVQPHFYGAPDLDLTIKPGAGMVAGDKGYFFGLDRFPSASNPVPTSENVVLAGYEGGLDIHAITKRGLEPVASLKGLRGGVHQAKILPWTAKGSHASDYPLVAVVLHGPVLPPSVPEVAVQDESAMPPSGAASPRSAYAPEYRNGPLVDSYQTTVQVYSLKTNKLIDTLLQAPKVPINMAISFTSPVFQPPPPSGAFQIKADGGTVVVASGVTGECWIYQQLLEPQNGHMFACAGKIWTSIQQSFRGEVSEEGDPSHSTTPRQNPQNPILSINQHWIAYCPAATSSSLTMRAHVPLPVLGRAPGISTGAPPQLPNITVTTDLPISDSMMNKIMRETTQELIQGAKWVGKQGLQAWNTYWNRNNPQTPQQQARSPPHGWRATDASQFPPTHGATGKMPPKDPGLVSILDVETLATSASIHPFATFAAPLGCGFLSFSPSSLAIFTASSKGDVQTVWDLMRIQHTRSSPLQSTLSPTDSGGPQVRQIAHFSRMTVARIVDVTWSEPLGERLAMVTERGTVHLMEIPISAFTWPPPRRRKATPEETPETPETTTSAASIASGALGAAYQAAKPFVSRPRRSSANIPANTGNTFKDSAAQGGRIIAASISHSVGKTGTAISQLRHIGENRVSLPASPGHPSAACVAWVKGRKSMTLYAIGGGVVRSFPWKPSTSTNQGRTTKVGRYKDSKVPLLPDDSIPPVVRQIVETGAQEEILDLSDRDMEAGNTVTLAGRPAPTSSDQTLDASIPQAEIEASAPYQPFHTDRRVILCEYTSTPTLADSVANLVSSMTLEQKPASKKKKKGGQATPATPAPSTSIPSPAWAFGQPISVTRLDPGPSLALDEEASGPEDHRALPQSAMERVMQYGDEEQIVVTTRRRRGARQGDPDEDGFFEDDCEVLDFADQRV